MNSGADQSDVISFLSTPAAYSGSEGAIERHETHGAYVFLAGDEAYKIKRAARFPYMDFSTLPLRRAALMRELDVNKLFAPEIYIDVIAVTRSFDGRLELGGNDVAIEWALRMRRFDQANLLGQIVDRGELTPELAFQVAAMLRHAHDRCPVATISDADRRIESVIAGVVQSLAEMDASIFGERTAAFAARAGQHLARIGGVVRRRGEAGFVRRCHGDLHLNNIVVWDGKPLPFDALEFDESLATVDTLYDLAFLLMDLERHAARQAANAIFNRYLWRAPLGLEVEGLAALPLFMALRAGVRALVTAERSLQLPERQRSLHKDDARSFLDLALQLLVDNQPRLVAIGGLSGTGKSTLATALAPQIGAAPGALHLRTDIERKAMFNVAAAERLPMESYTQAASDAVYARVIAKARGALVAGRTVVVDAVFSKPEERRAIETVAQDAGVTFHGLWLEASEQTMLARVAARHGDASDATEDVVRRQLQRGIGALTWARVEAGRTPEETVRAAAENLKL